MRFRNWQQPPLGLLCFGFVICGIVTVLPGPLLPALAAKWGLRDVQSGDFFAAEFAASTLAAIVSPRRLGFSVPFGYAFMSAGVLLLATAAETAQPGTGRALAMAAYASVGLGIGLSVTATNLSVASGSGTEGPGNRARRLSLVNLWWGFGAVACPWLVAVAVRGNHLRPLLFAIAAAAVASFLGLLPMLRGSGAQPHPRASAAPLRTEVPVLAFFAVMLFLYVGVETTVGGWIPTYAHRFSAMTVERASLLVSVYWLALLAGRGIGSVILKTVPERGVLLPSLMLGVAAVAVLISPHSTWVVLVAVAAAGMGFGPIFPVGVSRMLARIADQRHTGWVFAMCASGGAVLPWLTGLVSTRSRSLRIGFAVPVAALALILLLALVENTVLRKPPQPARQRA